MVVGLLLAAGAGRRYDPTGRRLKLLEPLPGLLPGNTSHLTVAEVAARNLHAACDVVVAVVRPADTPAQAQLHAALAKAGCQLTLNERAEQGMGESIAAGIRYIEQIAPRAAGCVVALADMPFIAVQTIEAVAAAIRAGHLATAPLYEGRRGHPVGFARALFKSLTALQGDQGARAVLAQHAVHLIEVTDPGVEHDIDTPLHCPSP